MWTRAFRCVIIVHKKALRPTQMLGSNGHSGLDRTVRGLKLTPPHWDEFASKGSEP